MEDHSHRLRRSHGGVDLCILCHNRLAPPGLWHEARRDLSVIEHISSLSPVEVSDGCPELHLKLGDLGSEDMMLMMLLECYGLSIPPHVVATTRQNADLWAAGHYCHLVTDMAANPAPRTCMNIAWGMHNEEMHVQSENAILIEDDVAGLSPSLEVVAACLHAWSVSPCRDPSLACFDLQVDVLTRLRIDGT